MDKSDPKENESGRYAYDGLDRVLHEKARLGIVTSLSTHPKGLVFGDLKELCSLTDGNLSRHLQILQEANVVEITKSFHNNRPQTLCRLTPSGRRRFLEYINVLESVVTDALTSTNNAPASKKKMTEGFSPA